ncbi:tautomerase family protein [Paraburkholderia youngii]|uniref:tautomerase family protein n=1 Tax=Paraburkholderia youngii TaxID=2782701 RepID=UPI003D208630
MDRPETTFSHDGLHWEMHVDETPFSLRTIQGLRPPVPRTPEGEKWRSENRPSACEKWNVPHPRRSPGLC